jgi:hypothetical protein
MGITGAEKQRRFRERNMVVLTASAEDIAATMIGMSDQKKLRSVVRYLKDHLKNPDRGPCEREAALGRIGIAGMSRAETLASLAAQRAAGTWRVEAISTDGRRWANGVRLATKKEADIYALGQCQEFGYVTAEALQEDGLPNGSVTWDERGQVTLHFRDGDCVLQNWRPMSGALAAE